MQNPISLIEFRTAEGHNDRLPALVSDLIRRPVTAIFCNTAAAQVAKAATTTIPSIFTTGSDPVRDGVVASLNRPGGNLAGASFFSGALGGKRLELLRQLLPKATAFVMLVNPQTPESEGERRDVEAAAQSLGQAPSAATNQVTAAAGSKAKRRRKAAVCEETGGSSRRRPFELDASSHRHIGRDAPGPAD